MVETYEVNGLTYQYTGTFQNLEVLSLWEKYSAFDDVKEENLSQDEKEQRAERFQNYIKAGNQNMTEEDAENYVKDRGYDNAMNMFFGGIKNYKKMAEWLTKWSPILAAPIIENANDKRK